MRFTTRLKLNTPNVNGRIYTTECMQKAIKEAETRLAAGLYVGKTEQSGTFKLSSAAGIVEAMTIDMEHEELVVEANIFNDSDTEFLKNNGIEAAKILADGGILFPIGYATMKTPREVEFIEIIAFSIAQ